METFDVSFIILFLPTLLRGFLVTLYITIGSTVIGLLIVAAFYIIREKSAANLRPILARMSYLYIDIIQATPALIALVWVYFGLPSIGVRLSSDICAMLVFGVSFSAFALDLFIAAERSISEEAIFLAKIHKVSSKTIFRKIYLPEISKVTMDPFIGQVITLAKLTTLAYVIGTQEILSVANGVISQTYRPIEIYTLVALIFIIVIAPINLLRRRKSDLGNVRSDPQS